MNNNLYSSVTNFIKKRTFELLGLLLISISLVMLVAFITYSPNDPSFVYNEQNTIILNFFGIYGSIVSDFLLQSFGILSFLILVTLVSWGVHLIMHKRIDSFIFKILFLVLYLIFGCIYIYVSFNHSWWLDPHGNSGFVGELLYSFASKNISYIDSEYSSFFLIFITFISFILSTGVNIKSSLIVGFNFLSGLFKSKKIKQI